MQKNERLSMHSTVVRNIFLILLGFLGLGAIVGGIVLMISPTGELMGMPLSEFKNLPFDNYFIPGLILFAVLGIIPLLLIPALLKKPKSILADKINIFKDMHWSWTFGIYIAFILVGWIHFQLVFLQGEVHWLQTFYIFYALLIILVALLPQIRHNYRKEIQ
jgi:hypothetical protein